MRGNKKAQINDYIAIIVFLFGFGFLSILGYLIYYNMDQEMSTMDIYTPEIAKASGRFLSGMQVFDYITVIMMVILIIAVGVASYKIASPPIFFIITFVFAAFLGFISYFFNYLFAQMVSEAAFDTIRVIFPRTILICTNLHWVMLVAIIVGSITLYSKRDKGQYV